LELLIQLWYPKDLQHSVLGVTVRQACSTLLPSMLLAETITSCMCELQLSTGSNTARGRLEGNGAVAASATLAFLVDSPLADKEADRLGWMRSLVSFSN
jgi:hypothetical protein